MRTDLGAPRKVVVLVGGLPAVGKSTLARHLATEMSGAVLDKDILTAAFVRSLMLHLTGDAHDRHSRQYSRHVRPLEYDVLLSTALEIAENNCPAVVDAPLIAEMSNVDWFADLQRRAHAREIQIEALWLSCDWSVLKERMQRRGAQRDAWKLENWDDYVRGVNPGPLAVSAVEYDTTRMTMSDMRFIAEQWSHARTQTSRGTRHSRGPLPD